MNSPASKSVLVRPPATLRLTGRRARTAALATLLGILLSTTAHAYPKPPYPNPPTPPPGVSLPSFGPSTGPPKLSLPSRPPLPVKTSPKLVIPLEHFERLADAARSQGLKVDFDRSIPRLTVWTKTGELVQSMSRTGPNTYGATMALGQGNECDDRQHTFYTGVTDANDVEPVYPWQYSGFDVNNPPYNAPAMYEYNPNGATSLWNYVPRWFSPIMLYTWFHNYESFRLHFLDNNGNPRDTSWHDYAAHEFGWGRGTNRCNWWLNDPGGNGAGRPDPDRWMPTTFGGDTDQSGVCWPYWDDVYGFDQQAVPENEWCELTDNVNTVEAAPASTMRWCGCDAYASFEFTGKLYDVGKKDHLGNYGVWRPWLRDADIVVDGDQGGVSDDKLFYIFTHEVGHTFGFGHVYDAPNTHTVSTSSFQTMGYNSLLYARQGMADGLYLGLGEAFAANRSYFGWD